MEFSCIDFGIVNQVHNDVYHRISRKWNRHKVDIRCNNLVIADDVHLIHLEALSAGQVLHGHSTGEYYSIKDEINKRFL